jgi:hypothetical protein
LTRARPFCFVQKVPPRAPRLALCLALGAAAACNRTPNADGTTQASPSASGPLAPFGAPAASGAGGAGGAVANAPPPDDPKPAGSADDAKPAGSVPRDPGRYRAPVVMNVRGGAGAQPGPIVVTIEVREPVPAPGTLALSYPLAGGATGRKSLSVSLAEEGTQTHTVALEAGARGPVRITLDASDPARGSGLHAERTWPEASTPTPTPPSSRTPGPPGGRPPLPKPG